jgi:hypothetical protein
MNDGLRNYLLQVKTTRAEHPDWTMKQVRAHVKKQKAEKPVAPPAAAEGGCCQKDAKTDAAAVASQPTEGSGGGGCCGGGQKMECNKEDPACKDKQECCKAVKAEPEAGQEAPK